MTKSLPPKEKGFWGKAGDWVKALTMPSKYSADKFAENTTRTIANNQAAQLANQKFTKDMEDRRERFAIEKAKADYLFQFEQGQLNRQAQSDIAAENRAQTSYENALGREFQADQAAISRDFQSRQAEIQRLFQHYENQLSQEAQRQLTEYVQGLENLRQQNRMEHERQMALDRQNQELKIQRLSQEFSIAMAMYQNQMARETDEYRRTLDLHPLRIMPTSLLNEFQGYSNHNNITPLLMIVSPLQVNFDKFGVNAPGTLPPMSISIEEDLSQFVQKHYPKESAQSRFIASMWESNRIKNDVAATHLYNLIGSIPTAILEFETEGDNINFRVFMWNAGSESYTRTSILSNFNYREFLNEIQKEKAIIWEQNKQQLRSTGIDLNSICPQPIQGQPLTDQQINEYNLQQWQKERNIPAGMDIPFSYIPSSKGLKDFAKYLRVLTCLVSGLILDSYHLTSYGTDPKLPNAINELIQGLSDLEVTELLDILIQNYATQAELLYQQGSVRVPDILINMAISLAKLPDQSFARELMQNSFAYWLKIHQIELSDQSPIELISTALTIADLDYAKKVNQLLEALGQTQCLDVAQSCYDRGVLQLNSGSPALALHDFNQAIEINPTAAAYFQRGKTHAALNQPQAAISDYDKSLNLEPDAQGYNCRGDAHLQLKDYESALANYIRAEKLGSQVAKQKIEKTKQEKQQAEEARRQAEARKQFEAEAERQRQEKLKREREAEAAKKTALTFALPNNGGTLELVNIPAGSYQMGSNEKDGEKPIHTVNIKAYRMGKYAVTQKQYQAVMGSNPSHFKGDNRPVERVNWHEAKEFCAKLSKELGQEVRLPSEAEWEYACRSGSSGKYSFGDSESELGNYAWYNSNSGSETHPVGQKKANKWGLYDAHGNVWEWCEDVWHENYNGAPTDGSAWTLGGNQSYRLLRGGSWYCDASSCRSAYRYGPDYRLSDYGFRVVVCSS